MSSPETIILQELLTAENDFVSGSLLADRLGVSRVAIWSHMEKLRAGGFEFEARPRLGYRITQTPEAISPIFIRALLPPEWDEVSLHFHETIDSTNSEAERLLANGQETPFVILSRIQTKGRGRLGRQWFSGDKGNLYLSFAFQPNLPPRRMQTFTLWMGASICHFLNQREQVPVRIKWPNDLLLDRKKIGGMLTEARIDSDQIRDLVFGLGLNVNGRQEDLPQELKSIATSIAAGAGRPLCLNRFTADLLSRAMEAYRDFTEGGHASEFRRIWQRFDSLSGEAVTAIQGNERLSGIARGIDEEGCLLLEQPDRSCRRVSAGDVTLTKDASQNRKTSGR